MILRITALILGALLAVPALAQSLEIIQLKNRPADQVLPVVRPLLEPGASASGSGFQLFVRTSAANLAQIRQVVASLDRAVRQLVIYVKEDADGAGASAGMEDRTYSNRDNAARQVRAQEGIPAFIASGVSMPVAAESVIRTGRGTVVERSVASREISSGFYVIPRVSGDRVFLDISSQSETPASLGPGSANASRIATTISGKLGAWIELGGVSRSQSDQSSGATSSISSTDASARSVYVKVEEAR
jgi:type II secretory pathway component GspD/PulD (secretin)